MHQAMFRTMIRDWREQWGQGYFPFIYAQPSGDGQT